MGKVNKDGFPKGFMDDLAGLIRIPSISEESDGEYPFGKACFDALEYALKICSGYGFRTKMLGNYMGYAEIGAGEELVGILAHLDVVPPGDGWESDPFELTERSGRLYGRGVIDDKGPAVAVIHAMKALLESKKELKKRYRLIFGCSEETGIWKDIEYYKEHEELPSYGFTPDSDFPLVFAEKGILQVELKMKKEQSGIDYAKGGIAENIVPDSCVLRAAYEGAADVISKGKAVHGSTPWEGINAIDLAMEEISACCIKNGQNCVFADFYISHISEKWDGSGLGVDFRDELSGGTSVNAGMIWTDDEYVHLTLDIRYPVKFTQDQVLEKLKNCIESEKLDISIIDGEAPSYIDPDLPFVQRLMEVYRETTGEYESKPVVQGGGTYAKSMPGIAAFGPDFPGKECTEHQPNENVPADDMALICEIYRRALEVI